MKVACCVQPMAVKIKMIKSEFFMVQDFALKVDIMPLECNGFPHAIEYAKKKRLPDPGSLRG
jgi:hypothetical protein